MNRKRKRRQPKSSKIRGAQVEPGSSPNIDQALRLGLQHHDAGRLPQAESIYKEILRVEPDQPDALHLLGVIVNHAGKHDVAVDLITRSLAINPGFAKAHNSLGIALQHGGRLDEAATSYRKALALDPNLAEAHNNLGLVLHAMGASAEAFSHFCRATDLKPEDDLFWSGLISTLHNHSFISADERKWQYLLRLLERPTVRPFSIIKPIVNALSHHPDFMQLLELTNSGDTDAEIVYMEMSERLSAIPLLIRVMEMTYIPNLKIERMLTVLRHAMLNQVIAGVSTEQVPPFSTALALHCFFNDYVFMETSSEKEGIAHLQKEIETLAENGEDVSAPLIIALGAYRPLYHYSWAQELSERDWSAHVKEVIKRQITEPLREQSLRLKIPQLTSIRQSVSQSVREQYEENPYPLWIKGGMNKKSEPIVAALQRVGIDLRGYEASENPEILVAGCGTGFHALLVASRYSNARVLAVDLSLSSLSYALRKTEELGLSNIEYAQGDIMELGGLEHQFDMIECVGVLHHLKDPEGGWKILVDLLRPGGLIKIGLYSEVARRDIVAGQSLIARKGYASSPEGIRQCRQDIAKSAEDGNQEMADLCLRSDFFSLSECRDLLFHVQEHYFTLPRIEAALKALQLIFLGFERKDQETMKKFKASHQDEDMLTSLSRWHEFELENPHTFSGMYQFWCKKP